MFYAFDFLKEIVCYINKTIFFIPLPSKYFLNYSSKINYWKLYNKILFLSIKFNKY